jgi:hypothetical protein
LRDVITALPVSGTAEAFTDPFAIASTKVVPDTLDPARDVVTRLRNVTGEWSRCGIGCHCWLAQQWKLARCHHCIAGVWNRRDIHPSICDRVNEGGS